MRTDLVTYVVYQIVFMVLIHFFILWMAVFKYNACKSLGLYSKLGKVEKDRPKKKEKADLKKREEPNPDPP